MKTTTDETGLRFTIDIQQLRNLTTGRLHTKIEDVYTDLEFIIGETGLMTHMLPRVSRAVEPWLRERVSDQRFWDDLYDVTHIGTYTMLMPSQQDRAEMLNRFSAMPLDI